MNIALVLLSGGMDSATCLWWFKDRGIGQLYTLSFDYNQRHKIELEYSRKLSHIAGAVRHKVIGADLTQIGGSPLTDPNIDVPAASDGTQIQTVVPFRNTIFMALSAAYAETEGIENICIAAVKDDYAAYRDCRREFYDSLEQALSLGATRERAICIHTPLIHMWKSQVVATGLKLGVPYEHTHTCYEGKRPACGVCDACVERIQAFRANGVDDPLEYESKSKQ